MAAPKRIDANQPEIVAALRSAGCTVRSLAGVGMGCPDLLVGRNGQNYLLEVKSGRGRGKLTPLEDAFHSHWRGQVAIVRSAEEALKVVGL